MGCIKAIAAAVLCFGVLFLLVFGWVVYQHYKHMTVRESISVPLPDGVHMVKHSRIGINPVVAEYDRDVTYVSNGVRGKTTPLAVDTCGGYPINCYLIEGPDGPLLRLDDALREHLLDFSSETTYLVIRFKGTGFIGEVANGGYTDASVSYVDDDPATAEVEICGKKAIPMVEVTQGAPETYLGRIEGGTGRLRFTTAEESPEGAIEHRHEW